MKGTGADYDEHRVVVEAWRKYPYAADGWDWLLKREFEAIPPLVRTLAAFPSPFTLGGVANVTFVVGETGSHGLFGLGARTTDVLGAIGVAYALGLASESGYCYWATDKEVTEVSGEEV